MKSLRGDLPKTLLLLLCVWVLAGILFVGLWPFSHSPHNQVSWLKGENGLFFGEYASILSKGEFRAPSSSSEGCSLELWFKAGVLSDSNTMLAFTTPEQHLGFHIRQNGTDIYVARDDESAGKEKRGEAANLPGFLKPNEFVLLTVTSNGDEAVFYRNGIEVARAPHLGLKASDLVGRMVVANSPLANDSWSGVLRGIAVYASDLSATAVWKHKQDWISKGSPELNTDESARALYTFSERAGSIVHNLARSQPDLEIPSGYTVLYPRLLAPSWKGFRFTMGELKDCFVNVMGFVPLGFFFCAYLARSQSLKKATWVAIVLGTAVTLFIESIQYYLPTRDSDQTDVINNILGTAFGALLYRWPLVRHGFDSVWNYLFTRELRQQVENRIPEEV